MIHVKSGVIISQIIMERYTSPKMKEGIMFPKDIIEPKLSSVPIYNKNKEKQIRELAKRIEDTAVETTTNLINALKVAHPT